MLPTEIDRAVEALFNAVDAFQRLQRELPLLILAIAELERIAQGEPTKVGVAGVCAVLASYRASEECQVDEALVNLKRACKALGEDFDDAN